MHLSPLAITANAGAWRLAAEDHAGGRGEAFETPGAFDARADARCRFCGGFAGVWAEPYHLDGDHSNDAASNVVPACPLCHACQHLGRDTIDQEFALIWLPEVSQAALNLLIRGIHLTFHDHGEAPHMAGPPARDTPRLRSAYLAHRALSERAGVLRGRLGPVTPRVLGEALLGLAPPPPLEGVRLLSRGRLFRDGVDVYPRCLDAWSGAVPP